MGRNFAEIKFREETIFEIEEILRGKNLKFLNKKSVKLKIVKFSMFFSLFRKYYINSDVFININWFIVSNL